MTQRQQLTTLRMQQMIITRHLEAADALLRTLRSVEHCVYFDDVTHQLYMDLYAHARGVVIGAKRLSKRAQRLEEANRGDA